MFFSEKLFPTWNIKSDTSFALMSQEGRSPLHLAVENGSKEMVKFLLSLLGRESFADSASTAEKHQKTHRKTLENP